MTQKLILQQPIRRQRCRVRKIDRFFYSLKINTQIPNNFRKRFFEVFSFKKNFINKKHSTWVIGGRLLNFACEKNISTLFVSTVVRLFARFMRITTRSRLFFIAFQVKYRKSCSSNTLRQCRHINWTIDRQWP